MDFRYKNMALFCFYCGKVGHMERNYFTQENNAKGGCLLNGQYGEWLRADMRIAGFKLHKQGGHEGTHKESNQQQIVHYRREEKERLGAKCRHENLENKGSIIPGEPTVRVRRG